MTAADTTALAVAGFALLVALLAVVNVIRVRRSARRFAPRSVGQVPPSDRTDGPGLPAGTVDDRTDELVARVEALERVGLTWQQSLRHVAVVRYDAFGDVAGAQSWSLAILDDAGDGVVVTAINGRDAARTYAKNVRAGTSDAALSPEELEAIGFARDDGAGLP